MLLLVFNNIKSLSGDRKGVCMVSDIPIILHPKMKGVSIVPFGAVQAGQPQSVLVQMEPNSIIPDHTHGVDAIMYPVSGSASLIADDHEFNGCRVTVGQAVRFPAHRLHGFVAGPEGFSFVSVNDGIVDVDPGMWDISFR